MGNLAFPAYYSLGAGNVHDVNSNLPDDGPDTVYRAIIDYSTGPWGLSTDRKSRPEG